MRRSEEGVYVAAATVKGKRLPRKTQIQISAVPDLPMDLSRVVTPDGKQLQTVGHHWPGSGPLVKEQRDNMERVGVCIGCHLFFPRKTVTTPGPGETDAKQPPITDAKHQQTIRDIFHAHPSGSVSPHGPDRSRPAAVPTPD